YSLTEQEVRYGRKIPLGKLFEALGQAYRASFNGAGRADPRAVEGFGQAGRSNAEAASWGSAGRRWFRHVLGQREAPFRDRSGARRHLRLVLHRPRLGQPFRRRGSAVGQYLSWNDLAALLYSGE